jgi:peptidoglycan/LPS O-acetylase OafA/YrhL
VLDSLVGEVGLAESEGWMRTSNTILATACFILAIVIFVFAEGLRVVYSGGFFVLLGVVLLLSGRRGKPGKNEQS